MKINIEPYFQGERNESIIFFALGCLALGLALWFWFSDKPEFYKGMAWPLLLVGLIQVVVGSTVYLRAPSDVQKVTQWVRTEPARIII
jgi:hypothetical protein